MVAVPPGGTPSALGEVPQLSETPQPSRAVGLLGGEGAHGMATARPSLASLLPQLSSPSDDAAALALDLALGPSGNWDEPQTKIEMNSPGLKGLFIFAYFSVIFISLIGNTLVCSVVLKRKRVHSATGIFIVNLAAANILITLLNTPFTLMSFISSTWNFGFILCHLSLFIQYCSVYVSVLTLVALAVDRYRVTMQPLKPRMTIMKGIIHVIIIWILATCFSVPHAIYQRFTQLHSIPNRNNTNRMVCLPSFPHPSDGIRKHLDLFTFLFLYILPMLVILMTYALMAKKLWLQNAIRDTASEHSANRQEKKKMILKMLIMVVVVFTICWFPLYLYQVLLSSKAIYSHETVYFAFHWFAMSSTCYNPLIYYWLNKSFRDELKLVLRSWWQNVMAGNYEQPTISATFCHTWRESNPFWETGLGMPKVNEEPPPTEQIGLSVVRPIIGEP